MTLNDRIIVFVGPSLPPTARPSSFEVEWRAPATAGDALALLSAPPRVAVFIDGLFDQTQAIRHKELLMLLANGVHVIGGASMGALRAAELSLFGMVGVGQIFKAYQDGRLNRDDEVALLHAPAELHYAPITTPLVNIRATLLAAVRQDAISPAGARRVLQAAQDVFYQNRTWETVIARALALKPDIALDRFQAWLPLREVDLKRLDALACLDKALRLKVEPAPRRPMPPYTVFTSRLAALALDPSMITPAFDASYPETTATSPPARRDDG